MDKPFFSIVVPVYNVEPYLAECLDSVVNQTFDDYEIILINDGSFDGSGDICGEYAGKYDRISLIEQDNQGLSAARNAGIRASKGEYIFFVDSDDIVSENLCKSVYGVLKIHDADMVIFSNTRSKVILENGLAGSLWVEEDDEEYKNRLLQCPEYLHIFATKCTNVSACYRCYKRSVFIEKKMFFPEGRVFEDMINTTKISMAVKSAYIMKGDPLYLRRSRNGSITGTLNEKAAEDALFSTFFRLETILNISDDVISLEDKRTFLKESIKWLNGRILLPYMNTILHYQCLSGDLDNHIKYVLFGASNGGIVRYLTMKDRYKIEFFSDNDKNKHGKMIDGVEVISPAKLKEIYTSTTHQIVISSDYFYEVANSLMDNKIISSFREVLPARKYIKIEQTITDGLNNLRSLLMALELKYGASLL